MTAAASLQVAPEADELEVSLFGPGRGEAVAVHLGDGKWITIDSCRNSRTSEHVLLEYFDAIGVDPAADVLLVVGTHAHDDHIAGISELYKAATSATFVTSAANTAKEQLAAVEADQDFEDLISGRVRNEYAAVYEEIESRDPSSYPIRFAQEQQLLLKRDAWPDGPQVKVRALSPSAQAQLRARNNIAEGAAREDRRRRLAAGDPNEYSVSLWIEVGEISMLFGGDLTAGPAACGWQQVEVSHSPVGRASVFKVPHHGSQNAHHVPTWEQLLEPDVLSVLTPFRNGQRSVPSRTELDAVVARSGRSFITANPDRLAASREVKLTRTLLSAVASNVREVDGLPGHIQARLPHGETRWRVQLGGPAYQAG